MKEILIKFENEVDYNRFIDTTITPEVISGNVEYDAENDIVIVLNQE